jgi:tRNA G10  N-methylase Trm11
MKDFNARSVCLLGRQPALGIAELEVRYGAEHIQPITGAALLDMPAEEINFKTLGGTLRVAKILAHLPYTDWSKIYTYLIDNIPKHLAQLEGGLTLGVSLYGINLPIKVLNANMLGLKKIIRRSGRSVRIVPNKELELNSAQVLRNQLTRKGGWELLLIRNGQETVLAQTLFIQDIDAYAARDQARPKRDARVGMLPPKLAQIIINLAVGQLESDRPGRPLRVLDPFCGSGVILQEALLMDYSVLGTDLEPRMVDFSQANITWLMSKHPQIEGYVDIEVGDATDFIWPRFSVVATETYLGRPLSALPPSDKLKEIVQDVNTIVKKFLENLAPQLQPKQRLCLAVPAWRTKKGLVHLPFIDRLTDMGYNRQDLVHAKASDLVYYRENQLVARELLILKKV